MNPIWTAIASVTGRERPERPADAPSLGRLLAGELAWAVGQALHPAKVFTAALVVVGVGLLLGPSTPGPVLGVAWRLAVAVVLGFTALGVVHSLLQGRPKESDDGVLRALRVSLAVVAALLVGTFVTSFLLAFVTGSSPGAQSSGLSASLSIDRPLLVVAALLFAGVVTAGLSHRVEVPASVSFLVLGMVIGSDGLGWVNVGDPQFAQSLGVVALVVILFDGGLGTSPRQLRAGLGPGLALATVGVGITAGVTAVGAMWLLGVPDRVAWLIGSIVASTDAAAVFGLVRRAPIPDRLASILQLESGANDPIAVLLTVGLIAAWDAPPAAGAWLSFGALQLIGGVAVGVAVGWIGARMLRLLDLGASGLYPVLGLAVAGLTYGLAVAIGASGFLAAFVAGAVIGEEAPRRRTAMRSFHGALASGVEVGLFLLLGLLVFPSQLPAVAITSLGVTALLVFVARPLGVLVSLAWFDLRPAEVGAVSWLGLRGAVPIVLATLAFSAGIDEAALIFDIVFFVVLTSVLLQGTTAPAVIRRLGLHEEPGDRPMVARTMPLDSFGVDVVEVELTSASPLPGRLLNAVPPPEDLLVVAIVRGGASLVPRGQTRLRLGDRVVVATSDQAGGPQRIERWVRGEGVAPDAGPAVQSSPTAGPS